MEIKEKFENYADAKIIARDYVCAKCFGRLITPFLDELTPRGRKYIGIQCLNCGPGAGFVTKRYAEKKKSDSVGEFQEARFNLTKAMGLDDKQFSSDELKAKLGFGK